MRDTIFKAECITRYRLSRSLKRIHERRLPPFILDPIISIFEKLYHVDSDEFEKRRFTSFSDYFTRDFKDIDKQRPVGNGLTSPVDASDIRLQTFEEKKEIKVKATKTTLQDFTEFDLKNSDFFAIHFYLSPKNYHRVHNPLSKVTVEDARYIGGHRLMIEELNATFLTQNERACLKLKTQDGIIFYLVLTGAFCVGNILFTSKELILNQSNISQIIGSQFSSLEEIARFAFGSSVSLILPKTHFSPIDSLINKREVKLGESLCSFKAYNLDNGDML